MLQSHSRGLNELRSLWREDEKQKFRFDERLCGKQGYEVLDEGKRIKKISQGICVSI